MLELFLHEIENNYSRNLYKISLWKLPNFWLSDGIGGGHYGHVWETQMIVLVAALQSFINSVKQWKQRETGRNSVKQHETV